MNPQVKPRVHPVRAPGPARTGSTQIRDPLSHPRWLVQLAHGSARIPWLSRRGCRWSWSDGSRRTSHDHPVTSAVGRDGSLSGRTRTMRDVTLRAVTVIIGVVVGLTFLFGFGNLLVLGLRLGVPIWVAPAVDLSVLGLLLETRHLALAGVPAARLRPALRLLMFASLVTRWPSMPWRCAWPRSPSVPPSMVGPTRSPPGSPTR